MSLLRKLTYCGAFLFALYLIVSVSNAQEFIGTEYKVLDPVIESGGYSSSDTFGLTSVISQISIGTSTISSSFGVNSGFLYFPSVSTPVVSASGGNAQVSLSWTSATGYLGWTVSNYNIGRSTTSGGPYTYSSAGLTTSATVSGLSNGTTYYFVVRPEDAFGNSIATSSQTSAAPSAPAPSPSPSPSPGGGGGGGGGGGVGQPTSSVVFSGRAYPKSFVTILKDAQVSATTVAGSDANFGVTVTGLSGGSYIFSVYGEDYQGRRSSLLTFPVSVATGATVNISGIFLAPTIDVDKSQVKKGDNIAIFGQTTPKAEVLINVNSENDIYVKTKSDNGGIYLHNFDTAELEIGQHFTRSKSSIEGDISTFGKSIGFLVGSKNISSTPEKKCPQKGDVNNDCRVNLTDFSIAAFWWNRVLTAKAISTVDAKLYPDSKITLRDFSVMAYYWTG